MFSGHVQYLWYDDCTDSSSVICCMYYCISNIIYISYCSLLAQLWHGTYNQFADHTSSVFMYGHKYSKSMDQPGKIRLPILYVVS